MNGHSQHDVERGSKLSETLDETTSLPNGRIDCDEETMIETHKSATDMSRNANLFASLIFLIGVALSAAFLTIGIMGARQDKDDEFMRRASELVKEIEASWKDYEVAGLWIHEACRHRDISRDDFRDLYEHLSYGGLEFQAAEFIPNVTREEREGMEAEIRAYLKENFPDVNYRGFVGFEPTAENPNELSIQNRSEQDFYFPVHFVEPVEGNEAAIDFDLYSSASRRRTIELALETWKPALTARLSLVQETDPNAFSVLLMHPGIPVSGDRNLKAGDLSLMVIRIPDLLERASDGQSEKTSVYIFDSTHPTNHPQFLGGAVLNLVDGDVELDFVAETELSVVRASGASHVREEQVSIASRQWTVAVAAVGDTYEPALGFVILGGVMIFVACTCVALYVFTNMRRQAKINKMKSAAEAEKAAMIVESATRAAKVERERNDFIAHEVRNPLAAAMSACSFVSSAVHAEATPLTDDKTRKSVQEDISIIESSLHFINDLLRNMLDMQRAESNQLKVTMRPTDLLCDVLKPVDSMLYRRGDNVQVSVECPENMVVMTDRLRLKQIVLNLGRNSAKFVDKGFIRFRVAVLDELVHLYVEDSGPGIPSEKREKLFSKFQESLDALNQGTGIGLSLCKDLCELMNGDIWLDETYDSGVEGCPGTRFAINLNTKPIKYDGNVISEKLLGSAVQNSTKKLDESARKELPEKISVLFVDDDLILRKLFSRMVRKVAPGWEVQEAANGETALLLVDTQQFDLFFVDQYMASVEKQLLGTETVRALRAKGVKSRICGLSANDVEQPFMDAGADTFMFKPFPTKKDALTDELKRVLLRRESSPLRNSRASPLRLSSSKRRILDSEGILGSQSA